MSSSDIHTYLSLLQAYLSPFGNEIRICILVLHQVIVQLSRNRFTFIVEIVDIA